MELKVAPGHTSKNLASEIEYSTGSVVSKQLIKKKAGNITLFAFDKGEGLSEHTAPFDALVQILDGKALIRLDKNNHHLDAGDFIILPAGTPHALTATEKFKMMLVMIRSEE
ncbi:MAG: cupin domain-containing protein [Bacteroidales bacterium]|nr:cupin domain-containing protein [Bacteroidales bacterium]